MPTYEYACPKCGARFEKFQSMNDEPLKKCLKCGKAGVKRLVGLGAGLIFKGSGFYITDYKTKKGTPDSDGGATKAGGETKAGSETKGGGETKVGSEAKAGRAAKPGKAVAGSSKA
jgi:putative FmdB family regulatory protein